MKCINTLFLIPVIFIITSSFVAISCFGSVSDSKLSIYSSKEGYSNTSNPIELRDQNINLTSPSTLTSDENKDY